MPVFFVLLRARAHDQDRLPYQRSRAPLRKRSHGTGVWRPGTNPAAEVQVGPATHLVGIFARQIKVFPESSAGRIEIAYLRTGVP